MDDDDKPILIQLPRLPRERLWCSYWYGYCAGCALLCPDRMEDPGQPRKRSPLLPDDYEPLTWGGDGSC